MNDGSDEWPSNAGLIQAWKKLSQRVLPSRRDPSEGAELVEWTLGEKLDVLAAFNEDIRERCEHVLGRASDLIALRTEFVRIFEDVRVILTDAENTQSELVERTASLEREQREHGELKAHHRLLRESNERNHNEIRLLKSEVQRYSELVSSRETRILSLEEELRIAGEGLKTLSLELSDEKLKSEANAAQSRVAEAEIARSETLIEGVEEQMARLDDRCATAEFHARTLEERLNEARLEQEIAAELARRREDAAQEEFFKLKSSFDAQLARSEAAEKTLADVRGQLHAAAADLREKESQLEQLEARETPLEQRLSESMEEVAALTREIAHGERTRTLLADRSQALIRAMSDHQAKTDLANERVINLEQRLSNEGLRFANETQLYETRMRELAELLEREKNAHAITTSALHAARTQAAARRVEASAQVPADAAGRPPVVLPGPRLIPREPAIDRRPLPPFKTKGRST